MKSDIRLFQENTTFLVRCADTDKILCGLFDPIDTDTKAYAEAKYFTDKGFVKNTYIEEIEND